MTKTVDYYFDFGSPNCYLALTQLRGIAERTGAGINWHPMLLGGVFKATGGGSPAGVPAKGRYTGLQSQRFAKRYGVPYVRNPDFPINTMQMMRGAIAFQAGGDDAAFQRYMDVMSHHMWVEPKKLDEPDVLAQVLTDNGFDAADFADRIVEPEIKKGLITATEAAVARGVFGAPTFFVGEEMFFGQDMLWLVEEYLA